MIKTWEGFVVAVGVVLVLGVVMSLATWCLQRKCREKTPGGESIPPPLPGGWLLGLLECYFYFAVLSMQGATLLAPAWLVFKLGNRWESTHSLKPPAAEIRVSYRAFQVGTIGNLLVGIIGAAIARI